MQMSSQFTWPIYWQSIGLYWAVEPIDLADDNYLSPLSQTATARLRRAARQVLQELKQNLDARSSWLVWKQIRKLPRLSYIIPLNLETERSFNVFSIRWPAFELLLTWPGEVERETR